MDNKLNYQQARSVRSQSLKDVIADELIRGKGLGSSITGAISLKTQARMKGIKEKFDPLNIIKFLTFGSRLGPALYGKLFGRSQKDIEYFAGRAKPIGRGKQKLVKDRTDDGDEDTSGMKTVLNQMLTFMKKSREDDLLMYEKENNLKESNKLHEEKRHKDLLKALGARTTEVPTATIEKPKEDNGFLNGLMDSIKKLIEGMEAKIRDVIESVKNISKMLGSINNIAKLIQNVAWLLRVVRTPTILFLAGLALFEFDKWVSKKVDDAMDVAEKEAIERGDVTSLRKHLENRNKKNLDKAARTGDALDAGVYTDPMTIGNIMVNPAEIRKKTKESFEFAAKTETDQLKRQKAINALQEIEADTQSRKLEYLKKNNIDVKSATPQQLQAAQDYADEKIDIKGLPTWVKPAIPAKVVTPLSKTDKETLTTVQDIPANFWKWYQQPDATANTEDAKMYQKMSKVIADNPLGPWEFDKKIPGYNEWNRTVPKPMPAAGKQSSLNDLIQDNIDLKLIDSTSSIQKNKAAQEKINSASTKVASSQSIPMPLSRNQDSTYNRMLYNSIRVV